MSRHFFRVHRCTKILLQSEFENSASYKHKQIQSVCHRPLNKAALSTEARQQNWDLMTAVCLERKPVVSSLPNDIQQKFQKLLQTVELERSFRSDHEIRQEMDKKQAELLKKGDVDVDATLKETAQDFEDISMQEFQQFKLADRITNDDKSNNVKSLKRRLDKHLVLLVKQKVGTKEHFILPQSLRQDGETLRQTAERVLKENCPNIKATFFGNAPCGFYKYKYPERVRSERDAVGAKIFFYFARHVQGDLDVKSAECKWLDRTELKKELHEGYHEGLAQFLIDEDQ